MLGGLGRRGSFLFPPLFSLCHWKQPLTLLTSHPTDQKSGLGFPVTKVATQELSVSNRALLPEASLRGRLSQPSPFLQRNRDCPIRSCPSPALRCFMVSWCLWLLGSGSDCSLALELHRSMILGSCLALPHSVHLCLYIFKQKSSVDFGLTHHCISGTCHRPGAQ